MEFAAIFGSVLGALIGMQTCLWILGAEFPGPRQVLGGYVLWLIASSFVRAVGTADGGPPNFSQAWVDLIAVPIAGWLHWFAIKGQRG